MDFASHVIGFLIFLCHLGLKVGAENGELERSCLTRAWFDVTKITYLLLQWIFSFAKSALILRISVLNILCLIIFLRSSKRAKNTQSQTHVFPPNGVILTLFLVLA